MAPWRTLGLEPCRHIHDVAMDVSSVWNYISEVDAEAKADQPIGGLIAIVCGNLLLYVHGAAHRSFNAIEHHEQRIAPGVDNPTAMFVDGRVNQCPAEHAESFEGSYVIQSDKVAVTHHVGMDDGNQFPRPCRPSNRVRCLGPRHNGQPPVSHRVAVAHRHAICQRRPQPE